MSVYEREWYRKENEKKQRRQEGIDAMWNEVEPSHRAKKQNVTRKTTRAKTAYTKSTTKEISAFCPCCNCTVPVQLSNRERNAYTYTCPSCSKKIKVKAETLADKPIFWIVLGIPPAIYYFIYHILPTL